MASLHIILRQANAIIVHHVLQQLKKTVRRPWSQAVLFNDGSEFADAAD